MSPERATAIESLGKRRFRKDPPEETPIQLRIAQRPLKDRLHRMIDLASTLLHEAETLARDKAFTEAADSLRALDLSEGIDFYREVEQFETRLIKLALEETGGNQAQAARLLKIRPTTLNSKIKLLGIEF